jgi:hypothetical protein
VAPGILGRPLSLQDADADRAFAGPFGGFDREFAGVDAGHVHEVADQPVHAHHVAPDTVGGRRDDRGSAASVF